MFGCLCGPSCVRRSKRPRRSAHAFARTSQGIAGASEECHFFNLFLYLIVFPASNFFFSSRGAYKNHFVRKKLRNTAHTYPRCGGNKKHVIGYSLGGSANSGGSRGLSWRRWSAGARAESGDDPIDTPDGHRDGRGYHRTARGRRCPARRAPTPRGPPGPEISALSGPWGRS